MTFLSKLSSVSSITSFLSPPPLSRLCKKQTDPHLRNNQNSFPTQAIACVSCCTKLSLFEWGTKQAVSVTSQNFPILELTIHTAYSHSTFKKQQVNLLLIIRKKIKRNQVKLTNKMWKHFPSSSCSHLSENRVLSNLPVPLWPGFQKKQTHGSAIHTTAHCPPRSIWPTWDVSVFLLCDSGTAVGARSFSSYLKGSKPNSEERHQILKKPQSSSLD